MKTYISTIILAICLVVLANCNDQTNNQNKLGAIQYYKDISTVTGGIEKKSTNLTRYFQTVGPLAKANPNYQLSPEKIDSFERFYTSFSSSLTLSKNKLKQLGEFNEDWNMVRLLTENYEIIQRGYDSTFPVYLKVYTTGWTKASSSQKETIMNASQILNRTFELSKGKTDSFTVEIIEFLKKYDIKY